MVHGIHGIHGKEEGLLFEGETYRLLGACFQVYKEKGCGFHESVYQECLKIEFGLQGILAIEKPTLELDYKGVKLTQVYVPDFLCFRQIVIELKALPGLDREHDAQVMNYLKATGMKLGLLVNFGHHPKLEFRRIAAHDSWTPEEADFHV